jgi:hypothetical protein
VIALQNTETGAVQFVAALDGVDLAVWEEVDAATAGIEQARTLQRGIINRARDAAIDGGAETPAGAVDTTLASRLLISGAVQAAMIAGAAEQAFAIEWTLADNSVAELDGPGMIGLGLAVAAHVDAIHQRARVLKARIEAAETVAEVEAVVWSLEDPE